MKSRFALQASARHLMERLVTDLTASLTASPGDAVTQLETLCDKCVMTPNTGEAP